MTMTKKRPIAKLIALALAIIFVFSMPMTVMAASNTNSSSQGPYHVRIVACKSNGFYELSPSNDGMIENYIWLGDLDSTSQQSVPGLNHCGWRIKDANGNETYYETYDSMNPFKFYPSADTFIIAEYEPEGLDSPEKWITLFAYMFSRIFVELLYSNV